MNTSRTNRITVDVVVVGAGFAGMYMLHRLRRSGLSAVRLRGRRGRRWDVVVESLSRRPLRRRVAGLLVLVRRGPAAGVGLERALRDATGDPGVRQPRRRPVRPAPRHPVRHPRHGGGVERRAAPLGGVDGSRRLRVGPVPRDGRSVACRPPSRPRSRASTASPDRRTTRAVGRTKGSISPASGSASSAPDRPGIQSIPLIAEQAAHCSSSSARRTYTMPARNQPLDPAFVAERKANYAEYRRQRTRRALGCGLRSPSRAPALSVSDEEREATYTKRLGVRPAVPFGARLQRSARRREGQRDGRRVRARSRSARSSRTPTSPSCCRPATYPFGTQAAVPRHQLLRHVQP